MQNKIEQFQLWNRMENERPLIGFFIDSQYPLHRYPKCAAHLPEGEVHPEHIQVSDYLEDCDRLYKAYAELPGDFLWASATFPGIPWIEASMGCSVIADHHTGSTRSRPPEGFREGWEIPAFSPDNPWVQKMVSFLPLLEKHAEGRYAVGVTLIRGISDILSALFGGHDFLMAMMSEPEKIQKLIRQIVVYWKDFADHYMQQMPLFHGGTGSLFYSYWCPGRSILIQEDAAALLSPDLYEQFIFPGFTDIIGHFEHSVIHLHPSGFIPVDFLVTSKVDVIELHIDKGGPTAEDLNDVHAKILQNKPLLVWGDLSRDDIAWILQNQSHAGLAMNIVVNSVEEADALWAFAQSKSGNRYEKT